MLLFGWFYCIGNLGFSSNGYLLFLFFIIFVIIVNIRQIKSICTYFLKKSPLAIVFCPRFDPIRSKVGHTFSPKILTIQNLKKKRKKHDHAWPSISDISVCQSIKDTFVFRFHNS